LAICLWLSDNQLIYTVGTKTAQAAWEALCNIFDQRGAMDMVMTRRKFFHLRCDEDGELEEHIRSLRKLQQELNTMGSQIDDTECVNALLTSLPDLRNTFITVV
jgi:hypothetical protein